MENEDTCLNLQGVALACMSPARPCIMHATSTRPQEQNQPRTWVRIFDGRGLQQWADKLMQPGHVRLPCGPGPDGYLLRPYLSRWDTLRRSKGGGRTLINS